MKEFSVVIPTCHRNEDLAKCLDCLAPGVPSLSFDAYEVIVTDDGRNSTAEAMIREKYPWAKWTQGPRRGPAANRNHGARQAMGAWLVFTDDDCLPSPGWLNAYWEAREGQQVLEGLTRADREKRSFAEESPINLTGGYLWSCNFAIRRDSYVGLGGFDEDFPAPAMEDCDLRERILAAGMDFPFLPGAEVIHPWRPVRSRAWWNCHHKSYRHFLIKRGAWKRRQVSYHYYCYAVSDLASYFNAVWSADRTTNNNWLLTHALWAIKRACLAIIFGR